MYLPTDNLFLLVPNSLDISQQNGISSKKKRRRRRRPNEGMADFVSTYELTDEILGEGAWSKVATCRHRKTKKTFAVKVSLVGEGGQENLIRRKGTCKSNFWVSCFRWSMKQELTLAEFPSPPPSSYCGSQ